MILLVVVICLSFHVDDVNCDIHEYMIKSELLQYFQAQGTQVMPEYEIVYLPELFTSREALSQDGGREAILLEFVAFGRPISLKLEENSNLIASNFKSFLHDEDNIQDLFYPENCHYLHRDRNSVAAFSICEPKNAHGFIFLDNSTLIVNPLNHRLQNILKLPEILLESTEQSIPHIMHRATSLQGYFYNDSIVKRENERKNKFSFFDNNLMKRSIDLEDIDYEFRRKKMSQIKTLELALFFDEAAYKIFAPYMESDDNKIQDMLLAYMNGVQALYHHPSLGSSLELVLVRLDIMKRQPFSMPHYDGERSKLLDSFCEYQNELNPSSDSHPDHWDMALYISGLDFFAYENGHRSGVTMGLATVGGVCLGQYACIIAELGTTNIFGKPYPSAGFTSVYILAHEIGHNLGMHHDSSGNSCPKDGFIMSPSRGTQGETQWSTCSAEVMSNLGWATCLNDDRNPKAFLDHSRFLDVPGRMYTAKKQCEIFLKDKDAVVSPNQDFNTICYSLQCKTPHRSGYYFAGPALDGTECGNGKYCYGGECIKKSPPKPAFIKPGGWSPWKEDECSSGCIEKSIGYKSRKRTCNNPEPVNTDKGCEGTSYEVVLCKDEKLCHSKRKSVVKYASEKCKEFTKLLPDLDPKGEGLQAPHEEDRLWMACAIFCKRKEGSYYTPRIELNDLGVSPYFPDGTWCHHSNGKNYFCVRRHCLTEDFKFSKTSFLHKNSDIDFLQNARPDVVIPPEMRSYFSLGSDGKPLQTYLQPGEIDPKEEDWETDDYILLPALRLNELDNTA